MLSSVRRLWVVLLVATLTLPAVASADLLQSAHFRLDPNVGASFGGTGSSAHYGLTDAGGEAVVGAGASSSYQLGEGYVRRLPQSIELTVLPSGTYAYWPFDTGTGTVAYDMSTHADDATLVGAPGWATPGFIGNGVTLNGFSQYAATAQQVSGPAAFTEEVWFKSGSSAGGELMGFGDAATGSSTNRDRLIYLRSDGKITFGTKPSGVFKTITSPAAYNDGASWHHVVASLGAAGLNLYVDGNKVASDASTTTAASYSGYWRLGYDDLAGWPSAPGSNFVAASIDEARVFTRQLSDAEVQNDYTSGANALTSAFTLPNITPGQSQTYPVDAVVRTNAPSYDLSMQEPAPLTRTAGGTTFPGISGTIASPSVWTEGTTKGFGFTLTAGFSLETKWGSSPNYDYAAVPSAATVFHSRPGSSATPTDGSPETTTIQYRADASSTQAQGTYTTTIVYTAVMKP
jgi:hypothetical protein